MNKLHFDIIGRTKVWFILSLCIILPGLFSMATRGFNFGIDFTGGTIIEMRYDDPVTISKVRDSLRKYQLDNSTIQLSGEANSDAESGRDIMVRSVDLEENERKAVMASLKEDVGNYQLLREETSLPITVVDDPLSTVVMGTGKALDNLHILKEVCID